jgi:hypothetical protein
MTRSACLNSSLRRRKSTPLWRRSPCRCLQRNCTVSVSGSMNASDRTCRPTVHGVRVPRASYAWNASATRWANRTQPLLHECGPRSNWLESSPPPRINGRRNSQPFGQLATAVRDHTSLPRAPVRLAVEVSTAITKFRLAMHAAVSSKLASIDAKLNTSDRPVYLATT